MIGQPELPRDPRFASADERPKHIPLILDLMTQWFAERPFDKAVSELKAHDIPHSPIMSMADIFADPHYRARQMIIDVPGGGARPLPQPGVVPKLSLTPGRVTHAGARSDATPTRSWRDSSACRSDEIASSARRA